jgi:hypothetical protein
MDAVREMAQTDRRFGRCFMEVHFDESFLTLHWDEAAGIIWAEWKAATGGEPLKRAFEVAIDVITKTKGRKWLADTRHLGVISAEDVKWVNDNWIPRAVNAGVCWMAFVTPTKVSVQLAVKAFMSRINDRELGIAYFDDFEQARAWLRAQP